MYELPDDLQYVEINKLREIPYNLIQAISIQLMVSASKPHITALPASF